MDWQYTLRIKDQILEKDKQDFTPIEISIKVAALWKVLKTKVFMQEFVDEYECTYLPGDTSKVSDFNELLANLYDYCDYNRIWVE